jgi:hypothetical protein
VRKHIPKRVPKCLMLRNYGIIVIILSPIDFKKRLSRRDTNKIHLSTAQDEVKNFTIKLHEVSRDQRYGHIDLFGMVEHGSTLVLP